MKNKDINILEVEYRSLGREAKILSSQHLLRLSSKNTSVV